MGQYRQLPERIRQVHPRFRTPYVAILVFAAVAAIVMLPGETTFLAALYAFGATLSFTIAHVSVIRLRKLVPDPEGRMRKWRPPGSVSIAGVAVPLTAVLGGIGTFGAFVVAMALDPVVLATGGGWMAVGMLAYVGYRRHQHLPLGEMVKVESLTPLGVEEVEYESVLVAFEEEPFSPETVATAARLAARRARGIHVISLINVPTNLPLDAELDGDASDAQSKIEQAKLVGGLRVTGHTLRVRPGQGGRAICKEAHAINAEAIVMQLRYRNGQPLYGRSLQAVLADRPGRVIVVADPRTSEVPVSRS
jgi:APA family basic amino acid/polyamine antiporter